MTSVTKLLANIITGGRTKTVELDVIDAVTAGTVSASKVLVADASKDLATFGNVTGAKWTGNVTGVLTGNSSGVHTGNVTGNVTATALSGNHTGATGNFSTSMAAASYLTGNKTGLSGNITGTDGGGNVTYRFTNGILTALS